MADSSYVIIDTETYKGRPTNISDNGDGTCPVGVFLTIAISALTDPTDAFSGVRSAPGSG